MRRRNKRGERAGERARRPPGTRNDPWIPGGEAHPEELGAEAPRVARLSDEEDMDASFAAGVAAAGESDAEAGVGAAPEYAAKEPAPEIGVDSTFGLGDVTASDEPTYLDTTEPTGAEAQREADRQAQVSSLDEEPVAEELDEEGAGEAQNERGRVARRGARQRPGAPRS